MLVLNAGTYDDAKRFMKDASIVSPKFLLVIDLMGKIIARNKGEELQIDNLGFGRPIDCLPVFRSTRSVSFASPECYPKFTNTQGLVSFRELLFPPLWRCCLLQGSEYFSGKRRHFRSTAERLETPKHRPRSSWVPLTEADGSPFSLSALLQRVAWTLEVFPR